MVNNLTEKILLGGLFLILVALTFATNYYGSTDLGDYSDTARYFAGKYPADIRSSHSYLYGFAHAPLISLFGSYVGFKITSLIFLAAIILSVYFISGKRKEPLLLMTVSPVVWYMAPWINPIQLASLCLLWAYYFMEKYESGEKTKHLLFAGIFIGIGLAFWDTVLFFGAFMVIAYCYNKKSSHLAIVLFAILVGLIPRFALDYFIFGNPFFSLIKSFFGTLTNAFLLGRGTSYISGSLDNIVYFLLIVMCLPIALFSPLRDKKFLKENKKGIAFCIMSLCLILINPQIRYSLAVVPIIVLIFSNNASKKEIINQAIFYAVTSLIFIAPYAIQIGYFPNGSSYYDITEYIVNLPSIKLAEYSEDAALASELEELGEDYPNEMFIVIGKADYYQKLAHIYWGDRISKLISVQDYGLWLKNETSLFEKKIVLKPLIDDRRAIWVGGGIMRNTANDSGFEKINLAIRIANEGEIEGFVEEKSYGLLTVLRKTEGANL